MIGGVTSMRKHYMTLCFKGNVEITHIEKGGTIEVTFEQAVNGGFNTFVITIDGTIVSNEGFSDSDVSYFVRFVEENKAGIIAESKGEI